MANRATAGPHDSYYPVLGVEVRWCPGCDADRTVEMVRLTSDPEPVAVCTECGVGLEAWLTAELTELVELRRERRDCRGHGAA